MKAALDGVAGVQHVEMNFKERTAKVVYDPGKTGPEMLVKSVSSNGVFEASVLSQQNTTGENKKEPESL